MNLCAPTTLTMCDQMRILEPRLKPMIDTFENLNIGRLSQYNIRPTVPLRDFRRFQAAQGAPNAPLTMLRPQQVCFAAARVLFCSAEVLW